MPAKVFLFIIILGCNNNILSQPEEFRIIYIIHGDGNYLFHNEEGIALNGAERILDQSLLVAKNIKMGEVFIFYQKPAGNFLFFSKDNGEFYYYKNSHKISEETYSRKYAENFEEEAGLIRKYSSGPGVKKKNIVLYYGHQIPDQNTTGYHASYPEKEFGLNIFTAGLNRIKDSFLSAQEKFDLVILSTCRNGYENIFINLSSLTNYLIASPADIHLSHLNSESLISLSGKNIDNYETANGFAKAAFEVLAFETSTEISINVYDLNEKENKCISEFYQSPKFGRKNSNKTN